MNEQAEFERIALELERYATTRDPSFRGRRVELSRAAVSFFPNLTFDGWALTYNFVFWLLWQQMNDFKDTQQEIRDVLIEPSRRLFKPEPLPGGPNVAWLCNQATVSGMYAPFRHTFSYLLGHSRPVYVYVYGNVEPAVANELQALGHTVRQFVGMPSAQLSGIRAACVQDQIGTLISDSYFSVSLALFEMRSAPNQWYMPPGFQHFPCDLLLLQDVQESLFGLPHAFIETAMDERFLYQNVTPLPRRGKIVFGALSRFEKLSRGYLKTVSEILDEVPDSVYVAYGRGVLETEDPRIQNGGIVNPHAALGSIDVYLDSFPTPGGMSCWEAMAHGVPVVALEGVSVRSWQRHKTCVAHDIAQYKDNAKLMALHPETRAAVLAVSKRRMYRMANVANHAAMIEVLIDRAADKTRAA